MQTILAIDPGKKGGWAIRWPEGEVEAHPMPLVGKEINVREIARRLNGENVQLVVIEKVHAMKKQGVTSMFSFGKGFGQLIGMCQAFGWPYELIASQTWKRIVLRDTPKDKLAALEVANRLFPNVELIPENKKVPHSGMADALCLLKYTMEKYK